MSTIIEKIRAEVNRLKEEHQVPTFPGDKYEEGGVNGYQLALDKVLSRLYDLEKEEKPIEGLEEEIRSWHKRHFKFKSRDVWEDYSGHYLDKNSQLDLARHFYELGRQSKPEASEGLEEEISRYLREDCSKGQPSIREVVRHFAKWGAEHAKECEEKPNKVKADFDIYRFQQKFCIHCEIPHCTGTIDYLKSCPYLNK